MAVHFVAVAVAFVDDFRAVDLCDFAAGFEPCRQGAEAHGAAEVALFVALFGFAAFVDPFGDEGDHGFLAAIAPFGAAGIFDAEDVTRVFDDSELHAEADAEVGDAVFARVLHGADFAADAAVTEASRYDDTVHTFQQRHALPVQVFGIDVADVHRVAAADAGVVERFVERFVGVGEVHIFANHGNRHFVLQVGNGVVDLLPVAEISGGGIKGKVAHDNFVHALLVIEQRDFVDVFHVQPGEDGIGGDIGKEGDFAPLVFGNIAVGAANQHIRLNAD